MDQTLVDERLEGLIGIKGILDRFQPNIRLDSEEGAHTAAVSNGECRITESMYSTPRFLIEVRKDCRTCSEMLAFGSYGSG